MKTHTKAVYLPLAMLLATATPAQSLEIPWMDKSANVFESSIPAFVDKAIAAYDAQGEPVFRDFSDINSTAWVKDDGFTYIFVLDPVTNRTLAHGGLIQSASRETGIEVKKNDDNHLALRMLIHVAKETPEGRFIHLDWDDPSSGKTFIKRFWLKMHDNLIFASGEYIDFPGSQRSNFVMGVGEVKPVATAESDPQDEVSSDDG